MTYAIISREMKVFRFGGKYDSKTEFDENIFRVKFRVVHMRSLEKCVEKNDLSLCDKSTNRGLISEDRSTEATLLFTIPRSCLSRLHRIYL